MAALGLSFYPAALIILVMLVHAFRNDRYNFLIMFTILVGGFSMIHNSVTRIHTDDIALLLSCVLWVVMRKPPILVKVLWAIVLYTGFLIFMASKSIESMHIQFLTLRCYLTIVYLIFPLAVFSGKKFDIKELWTKIMPYVFVMCVFYLLDAFIFCGNVLVPHTFQPEGTSTTFWSPYMELFSFHVWRKWPQGMFLILLVAIPIMRYYRLKAWQWLLLIAAVFCTRTFTFISALLIAYILFQGSAKRTLKYLAIILFTGVALYVVDGFLPTYEDEISTQSTLRVKSSVDQFISLAEAADDEDLAEFGSGRMAQVLPKVDLVYSHHKEWTGLGFLHPDYSTMTQYTIDNEYYSDVSQSEEIATGVELAVVQVFLHIGYIGLIVHCIFFFVLWWFIRKLEYSSYYLCMLFMNVWLGFGGFATLYSPLGLILNGFAYGVVLLANRKQLGFAPALGKVVQ